MILKIDCKHYLGDRPCFANKQYGLMCNNCNYYENTEVKILIIKLDAIGDVLRTTSVLPAVKKKYPNSSITWVTKKNASDIFKNNSLVDQVITIEDPLFQFKIISQRYDLLIHPDASPSSSAIASLVKSNVKKGFQLNEDGKVYPVNEEAIEWLQMGSFDQLKKQNKKTYQQILHEISGLDYKKARIIINLTDEETIFKNEFISKNSLNRYKNIIGLNTGSSGRWKLKQWRVDGFIELIKLLDSINDTAILLFGGTLEKDINQHLIKFGKNVFDTGSSNTLREFFSLLDIPDLLVTGDTLALHAAAALNKKVICYFGPTSSNEIEDYGLVTKIIPDMACVVCYKTECDFNPNCMDLISSERIFEEIKKRLK